MPPLGKDKKKQDSELVWEERLLKNVNFYNALQRDDINEKWAEEVLDPKMYENFFDLTKLTAVWKASSDSLKGLFDSSRVKQDASWGTWFKEKGEGLWASCVGPIFSPGIAWLGLRLYWNTPNYFLNDKKDDHEVGYASVNGSSRLDFLNKKMVHGTTDTTMSGGGDTSNQPAAGGTSDSDLDRIEKFPSPGVSTQHEGSHRTEVMVIRARGKFPTSLLNAKTSDLQFPGDYRKDALKIFGNEKQKSKSHIFGSRRDHAGEKEAGLDLSTISNELTADSVDAHARGDLEAERGEQAANERQKTEQEGAADAGMANSLANAQKEDLEATQQGLDKVRQIAMGIAITNQEIDVHRSNEQQALAGEARKA